MKIHLSAAPLPLLLLLTASIALLPPFQSGCGGKAGGPSVVVYASLDEHYAKPVLREFERRTGIRVLERFDTEADKTTGLYLRILSEKSRPQADVFWNNEILRTVLLAESGAFAGFTPQASVGIPAAFQDNDGHWTGFAARARIIIYNKGLVPPDRLPRSIAELADGRFKDKACIAVPLFGTTATHVGALRSVLGREGLEALLRRWKGNGVRAVNGNAVVRDLVASGEMALGLTDTDDAHEALRAGKPVGIVFPDQDAPFPGRDRPLGTFLIPNTVALVADGPGSEAGRLLIEFLLSAEVEQMLERSGSAQIPLRKGLPPPEGLAIPKDFRAMEVDYAAAAKALEEAEPFLRDLYLK